VSMLEGDSKRAGRCTILGLWWKQMDKLIMGNVTEIYELDYCEVYRVVVFHYDLVGINRDLKTFTKGHTCVNFLIMHIDTC